MTEKSDFTDLHQSILNVFKEKQNLSETDVRSLHQGMTEMFYEDPAPTFDNLLRGPVVTSDESLLRDMKIINKEIQKDKLKIISGLDENDAEPFYMLVNCSVTHNTCWDTLNVGNNDFSERDRDKLLELATALIKLPNRTYSGRENLTPIFEYLLDENSTCSRLVRFKWLTFDHANWTLSLGPRFIAQMSPWIKQTLKNLDQERIICTCGLMVLRGFFCACGSTGCHYHCDYTAISKCTTCEEALLTGSSQTKTSETDQRKRASDGALPSVKKARTESPQLVGLHNFGNTCSLNAMLQCLSHTGLALSYGEGEICGELGKEWKKVINNMKNSGKDSISPAAILRIIQKKYEPFRNKRQQDAHEMNRVFLGILDEESLRENDSSPVTDYFGGTLKTQYKCRECKYQQLPTADRFLDVGLEISKTKPEILEDCIQRYLQPEEVTKTCDLCGKDTRHRKSSTIFQLPQILCFHLKRFGSWQNDSKIGTKVFFPLNGLTLEESGSSKSYNLVGVICHHGNTMQNGGHYTAFCFKPENSKWYRYDDTSVTVIDQKRVSRATAEAYILFYQQQ